MLVQQINCVAVCRLLVAKHLFVLDDFSTHCPVTLGADHFRRQRLHKIDIGKLHAGPRDGIVRLFVRKILGSPFCYSMIFEPA